MPFCVLKCCGRNSKTSGLHKDGTTFHRFPETPELKEKWRDATLHKGWLPKQHNTICSLHFMEDCFIMQNEQRQLLDTAVPTLNLPTDVRCLAQALRKSRRRALSVKPSAKSFAKIYEKQSKKIPEAKEILKILLDKRLIDDEVAEFLQYIEFDPSELMEMEPGGSDSDKKEYSDELKIFAITLHFYSPIAYDYVRNTYKTCLPPTNRIFEWYLTEDGRPGFTTEAAKAISGKAYESPEQIFATVIVDEIQIQKDCSVNYGFPERFELDTDMAKNALFFLLVPINGTWRIPIGFFLANCSDEQKASLLMQAINLAEDAGVQVKAVTLSGFSDLGLGKALGCSTDINNMRATFKNPSSGDDVAVFLDAKQMIILIQFSWMFHKKFTDHKGNVASWQDLENVQSLHGKKHLTKWNEKSCSSLVLDKNLADYLALCHEKNLTKIKCDKGTMEFLKTLNDLVDILNSHVHGVGFKKALGAEIFCQVFSKLEETEKMLRTLSVNNVEAVNSKLNKGFLGLCLITVAAQDFIIDLMDNPGVIMPMHRTNPVNLQHFLGVIMHETRRSGFPHAYDVKKTYKKLLKDTPIRYTKNSLPYSSIVHCPSAADRIKITSNNIDIYDDFGKAKKSNQYSDIEDGLRQAIRDEKTVAFMAEYVARSLKQELKCETCLAALVEQPLDKKNLDVKNTKEVPSDTVKEICFRCEKYINMAVKLCDDKRSRRKHDSNYYTTGILESLIGYDLFPDLNEHQYEVEITNHVIDLTICVVKMHVDARLWLIGKQ